MKFRETDLYEPVRKFLEAEGYRVQAEVAHCDVVAKKGEQMVIVELKKAFNLKLVYQGMERQRLSESVFLAIPRPTKGQQDKGWKDMIRLLKRLELGLLTVALDSPLQTVDVILEPSDSMVRKNRKKKERLLAEIENRKTHDGNVGGMTRRKIMTAYREKAIELCCLLEKRETISCAELREMKKEEKYASMLRSNVYHWFERVKKGTYALSATGIESLFDSDYESTVAFYRELYKEE